MGASTKGSWGVLGWVPWWILWQTRPWLVWVLYWGGSLGRRPRDGGRPRWFEVSKDLVQRCTKGQSLLSLSFELHLKLFQLVLNACGDLIHRFTEVGNVFHGCETSRLTSFTFVAGGGCGFGLWCHTWYCFPNLYSVSNCGAAHYVNTELTLKWVHKGLLVGPFGNLLEYGFPSTMVTCGVAVMDLFPFKTVSWSALLWIRTCG